MNRWGSFDAGFRELARGVRGAEGGALGDTEHLGDAQRVAPDAEGFLELPVDGQPIKSGREPKRVADPYLVGQLVYRAGAPNDGQLPCRDHEAEETPRSPRLDELDRSLGMPVDAATSHPGGLHTRPTAATHDGGQQVHLMHRDRTAATVLAQRMPGEAHRHIARLVAAAHTAQTAPQFVAWLRRRFVYTTSKPAAAVLEMRRFRAEKEAANA